MFTLETPRPPEVPFSECFRPPFHVKTSLSFLLRRALKKIPKRSDQHRDCRGGSQEFHPHPERNGYGALTHQATRRSGDIYPRGEPPI